HPRGLPMKNPLAAPPVPESALHARLRDHFGTDPAKLPVVAQTVETYARPNLHLTIEELTAGIDPPPSLVGVITPDHSYAPTLAKLSRPLSATPFEEGPVEYLDVLLADDRRLACVKQGLYLFRADGRPVALLITEAMLFRPTEGVKVEVMA